MICPTCRGAGTKRAYLSLMGGVLWADAPCPDCIGGIASCCDDGGCVDLAPELDVKPPMRPPHG